MLSNYIKSTLRTIRKNKASSFLNIFGLATGIACAALILLWVEDEVRYDSMNIKKDRLYMVMENEVLADNIRTHNSTPGPMAPVMKTELPGIANTARATEDDKPILFAMGEHSALASGRFVDPSLFSMFTLPFVEGSAINPFPQYYSIVITEKTAKKFFGEEKNVVGKTVRMDNKQDYVVTGVIKDIPENSSLQFEWAAPFEIYFKQNDYIRKWENNSLTTYVELGPAANPAVLDRQLKGYIAKRVTGSNVHLSLFSMNDWHLRWQFDNGKQTGGGRIAYVHLFSIIAWIILVIACINFMNLATARSEKRAREVGVRKVLGAGKRGLIVQFIGEALGMSLIAASCAIGLVALVLPAFNGLVQKELSLQLFNPVHLGALLLITLVCGMVAGSYPSFYLSSFQPVAVLKGLKLKGGSAGIIRKTLVVLQFGISIVLIISTIIIYQQIRHIKSRDLGFNKDNLLVMDMQGNMGKHFDVIRQDLLNTGSIENVAASDHETLYGGNNTDNLTWEGKDPSRRVVVSTRSVSPEFFSTSGMHILDGRNFRPGDLLNPNVPKANVVITVSFAKLMGKGSPIGKIIGMQGDTSLRATVVGVVNDFVYGDMYGKPDPVLFTDFPPEFTTLMYVRMKAKSDPVHALSQIEAVIMKDNPGYPFEYRFEDEAFSRSFTSEILMGKLSSVFSALAILISCLGLFGLASYMAERRTKEIGIRKVLGATVTGLAALLSKDFLQLVGLSCMVAFPLAGWMMHKWLEAYAYRIGIDGWVFVIAGGLALFIALATVSFQAIRTALLNPGKTLRTE
jgi:putative ABC transport system permease protein